MVNQIELQQQAKRAERSRRASVAPSGIKPPAEWSSGPCCFSPSTFVYSCCCFPFAFGGTSRNLDNTSCVNLHCCAACVCPCLVACCVAPGRRERIRQAFKFPGESEDGTPCGSDCMYWSCCPCCAQSQESHEFKARGVESYMNFQHYLEPVSAGVLPNDTECNCVRDGNPQVENPQLSNTR